MDNTSPGLTIAIGKFKPDCYHTFLDVVGTPLANGWTWILTDEKEPSGQFPYGEIAICMTFDLKNAQKTLADLQERIDREKARVADLETLADVIVDALAHVRDFNGGRMGSTDTLELPF